MLVPADNVPDLDDVDDVVKESVEFVSVGNLYEVFEQAFADVPEKARQEAPVIAQKRGERAALRQ